MTEPTEQIQIPDQIVTSGMSVSIDLAAFFPKTEDEIVQFSTTDLPVGIILDSATGMITGRAPIVVTDAFYSFVLQAEYPNTQKTLTATVSLMVQAESFAPASEAEENLFQDVLHDMSYVDATRKWEMEQFVEFFIREHFAAVKVSDAARAKQRIGKYVAQRTAKSGWTILNFENYLMITPGNMAFEEYGNRSRLLDTLREIYREDLPQKGWKHLRLEGSDEDTLNKAWLVAALLELNVGEPPSDAAVYCYRNLQKLKQTKVFTGESPILPG